MTRRTGIDWLELALKRMAAHRAANLARWPGQPKSPKPRTRRPDEGGEPIPAVPRPKPNPLSGGAAAPIEVTVRVTKTSAQPPRVKSGPKVPSEADRSARW